MLVYIKPYINKSLRILRSIMGCVASQYGRIAMVAIPSPKYMNGGKKKA